MSTPLKPAKSYYSFSLQDPVKLRPYNGKPDDRKIKTIPQFFHEHCQKYKNRPALAFETYEENADGIKECITLSYAEYEEKVEQAALVLLHLGVQPRSTVAILAFNCPEWFYVELAAIRIGAVVAGIYTSNSPEAVYHVLQTSEASVCLVDDAQQMSKVHEIKARLKHLKAVVQIHGPFKAYVDQEPYYYRWNDLFQMKFIMSLKEELLKRDSVVAANECVLLVFTSGTTGLPKGVMLSHENLLFCSHAYIKAIPSLKDQAGTIVSYLPLNHIIAQFFDIFLAIENGHLVYFADRNALKGTINPIYKKAKGTIIMGVPRVFEKLEETVIKYEANSFKFLRIILSIARSFMQQYHLDKMSGKSSSEWKYWLASLVVKRLKNSLGLNYLKHCFVGGAPLSVETKKFFLSLDLPLVNIFGMSETSGAITYNYDITNFKTVGKPLEGVEIKSDSSNGKGEGGILVRCPCAFMGYLKEPEKTAETFTEDDWLKTGDFGYVDPHNNIYLSGRLKEIIITAGGENIPPVHIEDIIKKELPCISNALVVGDQRKYLTVLLTFKTDISSSTGFPLDSLRPETIEWLESLGVYYNKLSDLLNIKLPLDILNFDPNQVTVKCDSRVWQALEEGIKRYNLQAISNAQKVQYFAILPHDFSVATGELGPTLKVRRNIVQQKYASIIDTMYKK